MYAKQEHRNVIDFASAIGKLPPQCIEAEEAILGGILFDPNAIMRVRDRLKPYHFYLNAHQDIYFSAIRLAATEQPTDLIVVANWLEANDLLFRVGGRSKLVSLVERCVSAVNIDALADLVIRKWKRRELGRLGALAMELQHKSDDDVTLEKAFEQLQTQIYNLQQGENTSSTSHISGVMTDTYQIVDERNKGLAPLGVPTGFYDLDAMVNGGFNRGDLVIIAGRPAMGKSAIAAQIGFNVAQLQNLPVVLFSLEMSKTQIAMRMLADEAQVESTYLKSGKISDRQWEPITTAVREISELPISLNDCVTPSLSYFEAECRRIMTRERRELGLVVIDYLQLMGEGDGNRNNEIAAITRGLKRLAMKLQVPVICLSQLSRAVESRQNKRPIMSDLRDSGGIEQDGDKVMMLYRDDYYHSDSPERGICEVIIAKHRDGATGTVKLLFDGQFTQFKNLARNGW
ncbi:replicative DNA helicase [Calothrix sp. UHCC 0171]|uniref:replicative DNA helicase n=1 Tax=Calothrix sp. UHCC 0171 TaxID=3110245 RepID=UPI002B21CB0A|nr:replicative DNA helicase [Calothrix sp. UHCC 0171]MEA5574694.1 replicative DNA helicase [Calothrix sp. UHCC 0171]